MTPANRNRKNQPDAFPPDPDGHGPDAPRQDKKKPVPRRGASREREDRRHKDATTDDINDPIVRNVVANNRHQMDEGWNELHEQIAQQRRDRAARQADNRAAMDLFRARLRGELQELQEAHARLQEGQNVRAQEDQAATLREDLAGRARQDLAQERQAREQLEARVDDVQQQLQAIQQQLQKKS